MNSTWFSIVALLAALLVGYGIVTGPQRNDAESAIPSSVLTGYFLKDAEITQTDVNGAPHLRLAATAMTQNPSDNSIALDNVKIDYFAHANDRAGKSKQPAHWTLNADRGVVPSQSTLLALNDNVVAQSQNSLHDAGLVRLSTHSLVVDTEKHNARSDDTVTLEADGNEITGRGLALDLPQSHVQLHNDVQVHLAARPSESAAAESSVSNRPQIFDSDSLDYRDNVLRLTKVRSKIEPFFSADDAVCTGKDQSNLDCKLHGAVRFELQKRGELTADTATVAVRNGLVVHATVNGQPASFSHQGKQPDQTARGRARQIDYDIAASLLSFSGDVWFSKGQYEWSGEEVRYNLTEEAVSAQHRSHTVIHPRGGDASLPKPEPSADP